MDLYAVRKCQCCGECMSYDSDVRTWVCEACGYSDTDHTSVSSGRDTCLKKVNEHPNSA